MMKNLAIKPVWLSFVSAVLLCGSASAAGTYSDFPLATQADLKPFTRDIGGLLGSGTLQTARILGFGGFDIGVRTVTQVEPEKKNGILKGDHPFSLGWVQAQIGMPFSIDGFIKAGSYDGLTIAGGGLKYGLTKPRDEPYKGQFLADVMGNVATHRYFYVTQFSAALIYSINVPVIAPFFAYGFDSTKLTVQNSTVDPALHQKKVFSTEQRYTFGLRAKLNLGYISCGATRTHGRTLLVGGAGLRF